MPTAKSAYLILHGNVEHCVEAGKVLFTAVECRDLADVALRSEYIKKLPKNTSVVVDGIYTNSINTIKAVKATHNKSMYYLAPEDLTFYPL